MRRPDREISRRAYVCLIVAFSIALWFYGASSCDAGAVYAGMADFLRGRLPERSEPGLAALFALAAVTIPCQMLMAFAAGRFANRVLGPVKRKACESRPRVRSIARAALLALGITILYAFMSSSFAAMSEEFIFRFLPLYWWNTASDFGHAAFYAAMIVSNALFALTHLGNYDHKPDRHPLRTLPQFLTGFWDAYFFAAYGLEGAIVSHFLYDTVVYLAIYPAIFRVALTDPQV